ncbi:MAG: hypothetical protein LBJ18_02280 [Rickettsiales bacterium]|jgi:hypothetical protein|nr:hypothetical protein [Rickettsiales bacterium]
MKKILIFTAILCACFCANAATREDSVIRAATTTNNPRAAQPTADSRQPSVVSRAATARATNAVSYSQATLGQGRPTTNPTATATNSRAATAGQVSRAATARAALPATGNRQPATISRAATTGIANLSGGYNACRDAYFTCMDQFCAARDESYRRCVCSSRLEEIKKKERALAQTKEQLQDFKDLNINAIDKTGKEVKAMLSASEGESAVKKDTSASQAQLSGISAVLSSTKSKALSTAGQLDIAGDINQIWSTIDLAAGADILTLSGEKLYNTVHAQCVEFAGESCDSKSTLTMAVSAYGMYIENDCSTLSNALAKQATAAGSSIRQTTREMNVARLENYDAHNSASINSCIARVRTDITSPMACGPDYVHCLDITGQYLNAASGEPIYSPNFYQLETLTSLSGDVLQNQTNRMLVAELERKKEFAKTGLDTCRDLEKDVWNEFMRQAIAEIYQGQQSRIRQVKDECVEIVNVCYDTQSKQLKDFSNVKEQQLLGSRLELSEQMCRDKLEACSNLYGGGTNGMNELLEMTGHTTEQKIAQNCKATLEEYVRDICASPSSDTTHAYPYSCRTRVPGSWFCQSNPTDTSCADQSNSLYGAIWNYALQICMRPDEKQLSTQVQADVQMVFESLFTDMEKILRPICTTDLKYAGIWMVYNTSLQTRLANSEKMADGESGKITIVKRWTDEISANTGWGACVINDAVGQCSIYDDITGGFGYATYDITTQQCVFSDQWYKVNCENNLKGIWNNMYCYFL